MNLKRAVAAIAWTALVLPGCGVDVAERNNSGNALMRQDAYEAALGVYQQAQVAAPDLPHAYYNAARAYFEAGDVITARAALEQALKAGDPAVIARAYYNLGNIHFLSAEYAEAFNAYQQVLLLRPDDEAARYNLELTLWYLQRPTPTALQQQTEPEQQDTDPTATPTNQPGALDGPTPTPPPVEGTPDLTASPVAEGTASGAGSVGTPQPVPQGELTVEDAERLLNALQQDTRTLREFFQQPAQGSTSLEKDW